MATVVGIFGDEARALAALEGLRTARFDTERLRLVGGPRGVGEFSAQAGASANLVAGPVQPVLEGLVGGELSPAALSRVEERVAAGGAALVAHELEADAAQELAQKLREHQAEDVLGA